MGTYHLVSDTDNLVITPIRKSYISKGPCPRSDWEEQEEREANGQQMMWDDSKYNISKVGDILCVWHHNVSVTCHLITAVKYPSDRLPSWSRNVGQSDRNVIEIDRAFTTIPWHTWLFIGGHKRCMGTSAIKTKRANIISALQARYYDTL